MSLSIVLHESRETERNPFQSIFSEYLNYLKHVGFRKSTARRYIGPARHILLWLKHTRTPAEALDGSAMRRFVDHHCTCPMPAAATVVSEP